MADTNSTSTDDGQSIPAALAATPASRKPRAKAPKPVAPTDFSVEHPLAALVEAEAVIEAEMPAVEATSVPDIEPSPPVEAARTRAVEIEPAPSEPVPSNPTAAVPADPRKESTMATTIENMTSQTADTTAASAARAQAFLADAGERAKGAMTKSARMFEDAAAFSKGNVEALVESSKIAAKAFETMGQDAAEYGRKSFEEATAAFKTLSTVKSPTEFMKLQGDFMRSAFDSMIAETSRSTETVLKLAGEVAQPISNRMAIAADKIKVAA